MNFEPLRQLADALLYEGCLLYPYRASAMKNQRRWTLGCLFPPGHAESPCLSEPVRATISQAVALASELLATEGGGDDERA